jgi:ATPase subunit of ABC transporter with duplicated ATPase domains
MKSKWTGTADKRNPFVVMENKAKKEREVLESVEKPSFWIDKLSVEGLGLDAGERYQKYKAKNIRIYGTKTVDGHTRQLVEVRDLSLGYDQPLFAGVGFELREGERVELRGRNGTGKTTLIRTLLQAADYGVATARCFAGYIEVDSKVSVGVYEQEVSSDLFTLTLGEAIERIYHERRLAFSETMLRQLLADYLFEPSEGGIKVSQLSGGQKARLQLIAMLVGKPNLLVLDEPTNHLDLPSIEELENALVQYKGAILYVSHDSYFQAAVGGRAVSL